MPPSACPCAAVRPRPRASAVVNAEIHVLADRAPLADEDRARLARLWAEWLAAVAEEQPAA